MSHSEDPNDKFDKFIKDFDDKINKDTSTIKTIIKSAAQSENSSPIKDSHSNSSDTSPIKSPLLSTPTKTTRNSISLENQPLVDEARANNPSAHLNGPRINLLSTPRSVDNGLKRSNTINSFRSLPKKGLNLNLNINKKPNQGNHAHSPSHSHSQLNPHNGKTNSPETPSIVREDPITKANFQEHRRRRTNSSLSTQSSGEVPKTDDIHDSLRLLALKEMKIIELKDELKLLQQKIDMEEADLQKLKLKVGNEFKESIAAAPNNHTSPLKQSVDPNHSSFGNATSTGTINQQPPPQQTPKEAKRTSLWAKPISFLNQFDLILQNEIEKLNKEAFPQSYKQQPSQQRQSSPNRLQQTHSNPQRNETQPAATANDKSYSSYYRNDDVLNTVSNSLWSFVSDVKHGLLGDDEPAPEYRPQQRTSQSQLKKTQSRLNIDGINDGIIDELETDDNEQEMVTIKKD